MSSETYRPAFTDPPGALLAGIPAGDLKLPTPYVSYGLPFAVSCANHAKNTFKCTRIFIISSGTLSRETNELEKLVEAIGPDHVVYIHKGMTPHTPWSEILEVTSAARRTHADCILTLGAGSISDGAKLIVLALANNIETSEELARYSLESTNIPEIVKEPTIPLIMVPTTLSGGEYFNLAGGTDDRTHHKQGFLHSGMGAKLVILDSTLAKTTPLYHWLSTGYRSIDHCIEALCSLEGTIESDYRAESGLRMLIPNLIKTKLDPNDLDARQQCQLGVILAMNNVRSGIPMGGSHAIGHQLGPLGVPHGVTSCILCPSVMKYNWQNGQHDERIRQKQNMIKEILWSEEYIANVLRQADRDTTSDLGDLLDTIIRALGLPRTLTEMGVSHEILPTLAVRALDDFWSATNPVPLVKSEQVLEILQEAF